MELALPHQTLNPTRTTWHITWGTYGTRLHGSVRPTVDKNHNQPGDPFVAQDPRREQFTLATLNFPPVLLTQEQCLAVETALPAICERGSWIFRMCSGASDHVHLLCDVEPAIHGEKVRRLAKRWLGQVLSERWPLPQGATWWAEEGSNIAIHDEKYLNNAFGYILRQRASAQS
jgi:REP element-mobilizing transposase RayT